jgi:hypothetical protein
VLKTCGDEVADCLGRALDPYRAREVVWVSHAHPEFTPRHDRVEAWLAAQFEPLGTEPFEGIRLERARVRAR